jgi:hypothetical protein
MIGTNGDLEDDRFEWSIFRESSLLTSAVTLPPMGTEKIHRGTRPAQPGSLLSDVRV